MLSASSLVAACDALSQPRVSMRPRGGMPGACCASGNWSVRRMKKSVSVWSDEA